MSSPRSVSVVNVCFHGLGKPSRALAPREDHYWVTADRFRQILDEVMTWPSVGISFDDGNVSDLDIALPALVERGLRGDFFPVAGRLGSAGSLDEDDVRELVRHGMGVGSHGMRHRTWRRLDPRAQHEELVAARDRLAEVAGTDIDTAACPFGQYDRRVLASLRRLGYTRVFTSDRRTARRGEWLQPRFSVCRSDTVESFRAAVLMKPPLWWRVRQDAAAMAKRLR